MGWAPVQKTLLGAETAPSKGGPELLGGVGQARKHCRDGPNREVLQNPHSVPQSKSGPESPGHREGEVVIKPNTAGGSVGRAWCRHRKVVQNPHSVYYSISQPTKRKEDKKYCLTSHAGRVARPIRCVAIHNLLSNATNSLLKGVLNYFFTSSKYIPD